MGHALTPVAPSPPATDGTAAALDASLRDGPGHLVFRRLVPPHLLPEWAPERPYRLIAGFALTPSNASNGCLAVWPGSHTGAPERLELEAGDVVLMHPRLQHSSALNTGGSIRYAVYYRLLSAES